MTKKKINQKPKSYEQGWEKIFRHHLLGAVISQVKLYALEDNSPLMKDIEITNGGFGYLKIYKDYRADFYIKKSNKFTVEDWTFVFATLAVYLGLTLYKKYNSNNLFVKQGLMLFAISYVKNTLGLIDIPEMWSKFDTLDGKISFKNDSS